MTNEHLWLIIGFAGQALFSARFLLQWLTSEREGRSVVPIAFWYFSIGGSIALLGYAIHRVDPVFIAGQATGLMISSATSISSIESERSRSLSSQANDKWSDRGGYLPV